MVYGLLDNIFRPAIEFGIPSNNYCAIMLCFSHIILGLSSASKYAIPPFPTYGWDWSKSVVYSERSPSEKLNGKYHAENVDFRELLHIVNYFKMFFTSMEFAYTKSCYVDSMPHGWVLPISTQGSLLGREWRGTYGFLEHADLVKVRTAEKYLDVCDDGNIDGANGDPFQSMTIHPSRSANTLTWLGMFNRFLKNDTKKIAYKGRAFTFECNGVDGGE